MQQRTFGFSPSMQLVARYCAFPYSSNGSHRAELLLHPNGRIGICILRLSLASCIQSYLSQSVRQHLFCSIATNSKCHLEGYTLSTNRYVILEDVGCIAALHPSKFAVSFAFGSQLIVATLITAFACESSIIPAYNSLRLTPCS